MVVLKTVAKKLEVFFHRQILIKREFAVHVANLVSDCPVVFHHIEAVYCGGSAVGQQQSGKNAENACFSGAVGANQTKQFAFFNCKRHIVYRARVSPLL